MEPRGRNLAVLITFCHWLYTTVQDVIHIHIAVAILGINESVIIDTPLPGKLFYVAVFRWFQHHNVMQYIHRIDIMTDCLSYYLIDENRHSQTTFMQRLYLKRK